MTTKDHMAAFFGKPAETKPDDQRRLRARILQAVATGHSAPRELQDVLFDVEADELTRSLKALVSIGAVRWNQKYGPSSRYYRAG